MEPQHRNQDGLIPNTQTVTFSWQSLYKSCLIFTLWDTTVHLTPWGRDNMAAILRTTFSNVFSSKKMNEFWWKFHWSLFPRVQFPHLAIAVSPRMEVKSSGHAWLDGCNFQRKRLLAPTQCRQRHSVRTEMMREIYMNSSTTTTLYFFLWNDFCNPSRVLIMQLLFLMKLHSFTDKPTATKVKLGYSKEMVEFFILM